MWGTDEPEGRGGLLCPAVGGSPHLRWGIVTAPTTPPFFY
jgi:hypothetical protein